MVSITVRTKGFLEIINANKQIVKALERGDFTEAIAKKVVRRAKYRGPRNKGKLVRSIKSKKIKGGFKLICDAINERGDPYPEFLEHGTRFIRIGTPENPRIIKSPYGSKGTSGKTAFLPFMSWAIWRTMQEAQKILDNTIKKFYK